jgi:hypothetical protein
MATNSTHFRIGKSIEEVMLQRSVDADTLPPVHTSQKLQRTISRAEKTRKAVSRSANRASPLDNLRHSATSGRLPTASSRESNDSAHENFIMESLMEHCRTLQSRVQVCVMHR